MPSALAHLQVLAASGRPAGSASEAAARHYAQEQLAELGFSVHEVPFEYSAFPGRMATPTVGVALALTLVMSAASALLGAQRPGVAVLLAGLVVTAVFVRRMLGDGVLDVPWMRRRGVNLVATRGSATPSVWLVAHLDSKSQPIPSAARVVAVVVLAVVVLLGLGAALLTLAGNAPRQLWWIILVAGGLGALPVIASVVGNHSDGAVDNASGVAAVLCAAALVGPDVRFGVLFSSAEELGLAGARAFVRAREAGVALNCDGVDDGGALVIMHNGAVPRRVVSAMASVEDADLIGKRVRRMPLGLLTDSTAFAAAGWESVTVSHGSLATLCRVHTPDDSLARLRGLKIGEVATLLARAVEALADGNA